ncbi:preprotein translocase subunit YajC [Testudinibacter sp. TR-2022]|uniref:preprotein translocase subunit YajC n=1 Tax=Testudinibacter sp. TR-2022 TaxID=2585029 RepID=UPI00111AF8F3|nr:preprotein translocase subunit YajC [Testudinibacter sp. TR-2022]TNG91560.1 preprotein translocase subunit YajC [Pasteurellaceae bacterium USgator41]TNG93928.1 preprotein translocase subunit YajC [Pasteurellaceae bacterium UScroc12]TNG97924.1 preprotein translocase subunit YajC [Pasteurellaceae bacterium UScroc31]TNH02032.1 preprotein translocase subunit YajC [Pasteurellaceae bacterium USgator11]TNH02197.1 preprotein translocase subunit YajC [Pasteurellaceae bacterium Phil31]TNH06611.1 pre
MDAQQGGGMQMIFILVIFALIFYFMIFRPQAKRNKEHRNLMASLAKGEEVLTSGGLIGKITKTSAENDYIVIALNDTTEVTIKRDFVVAVLPKGSMKSL